MTPPSVLAAAEEAAACATALLDAGRLGAAREQFQVALELAESVVGPDAVELVPLLNGIGVVGKYHGDFDEAEAAYCRALAILDSADTSLDLLRAGLLHNIAGLAHACGDATAAEPIARDGIALRRRLAGDRSPELAADLAAFAAILVDLDRLTEAHTILTEVLERYEEVHDHLEVAVTLHNLGSLEHRSGAFAAAVVTLTRAVGLKERALGPDHPDVAISHHNLAAAQLELGHVAAARRSLQTAIGILSGKVAEDHPTLASCRARLNRLAAPPDES
ncbi:tetratricopeptide repeat protein [Jiangella anatolica]|uniref:Tetratricopeptide repeat protein n=1 Tax=Jiangella anatolica TaxID=2670374 RepID=A0A2W2B4M7_9ACTN|nr:tetratricopeptide repeat protein [Jiangella anatolica]PZF82335.1 hypothetical protein C1I92_17050 [Jiangella anatolica]